MFQQGQVFELTSRGRDGERLWAYRFRVGGRGSNRIQRGGFASERDAREALERELERVRRERRIPRSLTLSELVETYLDQHDVQQVTIEAEWIALEKRDLDRDGRVVYVRRAFTKGELKRPKTDASIRAVPLQARALDALERIRPNCDSPLLFPGERRRYLDIHHFRPFQWRPAQLAAGIDPPRRVYDLRHTFATFALRAGISTFDLSRYMGASLTMIDRHYGHLARDGREHAIHLLDALVGGQRPRWTLVDAAWTSNEQDAVSTDNRNGS